MKLYIPYLIFLSLILAFCTSIFIAPYAMHLAEENQAYLTISQLTYYSFHQICHQKPDRSFFIFGHQLAVCARCTGIYLGMLALATLYPLFKHINDNSTPSKYYLIASLIPMALDAGTQLLGLRESFNELRLITGFIFGGVLVFYLIPVFNQMASKLCNKFRK